MKPSLLNIIIEFAGQYKIDWRILYAILMKESNCNGFYENKLIKKRYEDHIHTGFVKVLKGASKHPSLPGLSAQWIKSHKEPEFVLLSTSFGIAQIMGYWYPLLNYKSIKDMLDAWIASEEIQVRDFCLFCVKYNNGRFLAALQKNDFTSIAKQYNGSGYKKHNYDVDLIKYVNGAKR